MIRNMQIKRFLMLGANPRNPCTQFSNFLLKGLTEIINNELKHSSKTTAVAAVVIPATVPAT